MDTNQIYYHPVIDEAKHKKELALQKDPIVDTSSISVGCCSIFSFCSMN